MGGTAKRPVVWHVGGEDVHLRVPLLLALENRGFQVGAVGSEPPEAFSDMELFYRRYSLDRWINPLADLHSRNQLEELFREYRPDIVHAFDTKPAILAIFAAARAGVPGRVRTITGMGYVFSSNGLLARVIRPIYHYLQKKASANAQITIFQNPDDRDEFLSRGMTGALGARLVLGSGADFSQFSRGRFCTKEAEQLRADLGIGEAPLVVMITRLVRTKGVMEYLQAARRIKESMPTARFLLVGPSASEGRQAVSSDEVAVFNKWVTYLGPRNDIPVLLGAADLFVLPSYYREGVPRVLLEAGAMGVPLITTDMPGCKEVVREGKNGWLVPPRDPVALAEAIRNALILGKDSLKRMGESNVEFIRETFSLERVAWAYAEVYREVLESARNYTGLPEPIRM